MVQLTSLTFMFIILPCNLSSSSCPVFSVCALCAKRKANLEECRMFYQFLQDSEEEEAWLVEKIRIVKSTDVGKDLQSVTSLLKKHQACTDVSLEGYQGKT